MNEIDATGISRNLIEVYGIHGTFCVEGPFDQTVVVRYFNTVASATNEGPAGNSLDLLRQLKPMRERVKASELTDLKSLLQRDLSDVRVAQDLVPYLQGHRSKIGFFPAILVSLVPTEFLSQNEGDHTYPLPSQCDGETTYEEKWTLKQFPIQGRETALGVLRIDPEATELVVLDGQHRANAFRYMSGTFEQATNNSIYSAFYRNLQAPTEFNAELPVTIVWFESEGQPVSPKLISRRLFVDVNSNALAVSESRQILLNDSHVPAIATAQLLTSVANDAGFSANEFSLLHTGFDCDDDFPQTALVTPSKLHHMFSYFLFAPDRYDDLAVKIQRQMEGNFEYTNRVSAYCPEITLDQTTLARNGDPAALNEIETSIENGLCPRFTRIFREFRPFCIHFEICNAVYEEIYSQDGGDGLRREVWERVFAGGEGLYTSFKKLGSDGGRYAETINSIDDSFVEKREAKFSDCSSTFLRRAFSTLQSKAGITGLFMALSTTAQQRGWSDDTVTSFLQHLNAADDEQWLHVLGTFKPRIISELNPKLWPIMRGLFLRVVQDKSELSFFPTNPQDDHERRLFSALPDAQLVTFNIHQRYKRWRDDADEETTLTDEETQVWKSEALEELTGTLELCGLAPVVSDDDLNAHMDRELTNKRQTENE